MSGRGAGSAPAGLQGVLAAQPSGHLAECQRGMGFGEGSRGGRGQVCPPPGPAPPRICRCCAAPAPPSRRTPAAPKHCISTVPALCTAPPDRLRGGGAGTTAPESFTWRGGAGAVGRAAAKTARRPRWCSNSHRGWCEPPLKFRPTAASELIRHTFTQTTATALQGQKAGRPEAAAGASGVWQAWGRSAPAGR